MPQCIGSISTFISEVRVNQQGSTPEAEPSASNLPRRNKRLSNTVSNPLR